jgi:hypothetical protein
VLRQRSQLILGRCRGDLFSVLRDRQLIPRQRHVLLADAKKASDPHDDIPDLATLIDDDAVDLADGVSIGVYDVSTDEFVGVDGSRRRDSRPRRVVLRESQS